MMTEQQIINAIHYRVNWWFTEIENKLKEVRDERTQKVTRG